MFPATSIMQRKQFQRYVIVMLIFIYVIFIKRIMEFLQGDFFYFRDCFILVAVPRMSIFAVHEKIGLLISFREVGKSGLRRAA